MIRSNVIEGLTLPDYTLEDWHRELSAPARVPTIQLLTFADWLDVEGATFHKYPPRFSEALRFMASRSIAPLLSHPDSVYVAHALTQFDAPRTLEIGAAVCGYAAPMPEPEKFSSYYWGCSETGRSGGNVLRGSWWRATMRLIPRHIELIAALDRWRTMNERAVAFTFWRTHFAPRTAWAATEYAARGYCDLRPAQLSGV